MAKKLSDYHAKRNFKKTAEPRGEQAIRPALYPRFVIQKHDATRLHYDLRLEVEGVFKSWAVTRGPSLDPGEKRLAVEVEDHPLDYGDFEGTIPKGEYGGGTVMLWDRGFWQPEGNTPIDRALAAGELKFTLAGEKLQGSFVLVRIKKDRTASGRTPRNNWLLIKHRDDYVRPSAKGLPNDDRSVASGRSMAQITAGKGPGPKPFMTGGGEPALADAVWSTVARPANPTRWAAKKPVRAETPERRVTSATGSSAAKTAEFIPPQLAQIVERPPVGEGWVHEIKLDGYRMQLRVQDGTATMRTRKGLDWTEKFSAIADAARKLPACVIDGEVVALDEKGAPDFAGLQLALSEKRSADLVYFAFDLLSEGNKDWRTKTLVERKRRLETVLAGGGFKLAAGPIRYLAHLTQAGDAVLQSACRMDLEGIVSKKLDAPYQSGRASAWLKSKCRGGQEVVVGGWSGSKSTLRSLLVGVYRDGHLVHTGRVGTGFTQKSARDVLKLLNPLATKNNPFSGPVVLRKEPDVTWVEPKLVAEIEFAGWTGAGMVRQASFKGLRADKAPSEIEREVPAMAPREQSKAQTAESGQPSNSAATGKQDNVVMGVTISSADKPLWPAPDTEPPVTKLDLARYLESVSEWMMEHLRGRPCSVIRAPDGLGGQEFFQRHAMPGSSNLLTLTTVAGDRKPYIQIDRPEALIALAQTAAVEFHPWNCAPGQPDVPGRLVFDLDPGPDVPFTAVVEAAKEMKVRLEALGLETFCKTTGGKGLHVVTPLDVRGKHGTDWPQAKAFAQTVCSQMAADNPELYLTKMSKALRGGRIYLDYLRNDRLSTAVAPLSPRARPGAPVSMPVTWTQVNARLEPARYTIRTVPALLARSKAWVSYDAAARPLGPAVRKLVGPAQSASARSGRVRPKSR